MGKRRENGKKREITGKLKNREGAGDDGMGQKEGASAILCFQNGAGFPRESGPRSSSHNMAAETQHIVRQKRILSPSLKVLLSVRSQTVKLCVVNVFESGGIINFLRSEVI